jgi:hypothetical protein
MHGPGSSLQETAAVRLYLDESGGDDPGTPDAVLGGMLIHYADFHPFEDAWQRMLDRHHIAPPLHMKEFGKNGRFRHMTGSCRYELFSEIQELVNHCKLYSIAATINNALNKKIVASEIRRKMGVYGMCFLLTVVMNHKIAAFHKHTGKIPFILDTGNPHKGQLVEGHAEAIRMQRETFMNVGGLHFEDDRDFGILQAADVIAWGVRRRTTGIALPKSFSPIERILERNRSHEQQELTSEWMREISGNIMKGLNEKKQ